MNHRSVASRDTSGVRRLPDDEVERLRHRLDGLCNAVYHAMDALDQAHGPRAADAADRAYEVLAEALRWVHDG
jgi:hypothetical protein